MKVLVTGAGGFVGRHLVDHLLAHGDKVIATRLPVERQLPDHESLLQAVMDITDAKMTAEIFLETQPEAVVHLAAISFVPDSLADPGKTIAVNVGGTANVLQAVRLHAPKARCLLVSSGEVYGKPNDLELPYTEQSAIRPANPYALSKFLSEQLTNWMIDIYHLDVTIARPFNHIGPGQSPQFAASGFARQLAMIAKGKAEPIVRVGNLDAQRDLTDVRDVVRAYRLALEKITPNVTFNICSGKILKIRDILKALVEISDINVEIVIDRDRLRPIEIPVLMGSYDRLSKLTGWAPEIEINQTLGDIYQDWLERI